MRFLSLTHVSPWGEQHRDFKDEDIDLHLLSPTSSSTDINVIKSIPWERKRFSPCRFRCCVYIRVATALLNVLLFTTSVIMFYSVWSTQHSRNAILKQSSFFCRLLTSVPGLLLSSKS